MITQNLERKLKYALTVEELIQTLQDLPQDAKVLFACDYGDHHHTQQALPVKEVEILESDKILKESAYSQSGLAVEDADAEDHEDVENPTVVILS